jgi:hypothetical protein
MNERRNSREPYRFSSTFEAIVLIGLFAALVFMAGSDLGCQL